MKNQDKLKIVMTGGGTGGHLFPAIAIAEAFLEKNPLNDILFVSTGKPFEKTTLSSHGFRLECIPSEGIKGRSLSDKLQALKKIPKGVIESYRILRRFQPDIVVGVGSYSSAPLVIAACFLCIPVVLHEQNVKPGITNRLFSPVAKRVYISFADTRLNFAKTRFFGNPVRKQIQKISEDSGSSQNEKSQAENFTVLVIGGSQGSHAINKAVADSLSGLDNKEGFHFIHQTGQTDARMVEKAYLQHRVSFTVKPFFYEMAECYKKADLVICRSGATTIAEITATGKPAIFIPFPYASDNHQVFNATCLAKEDAAEIILEKDLSGQALVQRIMHLAQNRKKLSKMASNARKLGKPFAAKSIVEDCCSLINPLKTI